MLKKTQIGKLLAGIAILSILVIKVGVKDIVGMLAGFNLIFLMPLIVLYTVNLVLGAVNLKILLRGVKKEIKGRQMLRAYVLSSIIGIITPGRIGELSVVYFLRKYGIPIGASAAVSVVDKIITLVILVVLAVGGSFLVMERHITALIVVASIGGLIGAWCIFISEAGRSVIKKYAWRTMTEKMKGFSKTINELVKEKKHIAYNAVVSMVKWLVQYASFYVAFFAFGVKLPIVSLLLLALVTLVALIPITIGGLGVKEAAAVYVFGYIGIEPAIVISAFLVMLVIKYASNASIMLYLAKEREGQAKEI